MRKLAVFSSAFSAGIFLAQFFLPADWQLPAALLCLALGWAGMALPWEIRRRAVAAGAALALGLGYNWLYARQVREPMLRLAGTERQAVMTLCDYAQSTDYGAKVQVKLEGFSLGRAVFYGDESLLDLRPGQTAAAKVELRDSGRVLDTTVTTFTAKGVFLIAYGRGEAVYGRGTMDSPRWWPLRLGRAMENRIQALFDGDEAGFLTAILIGDRSTLSEGALSDLSEAGLYHIMAVSGMHCGYLLTLALFLTGRHRRRLSAACAIPLLIFYALLAGGKPSVARACVMLIFPLLAPLFRRSSDPPTALSSALLIILLANPFAAGAVSLQLSFAAVAGLLWLPKRMIRLLSGTRGKSRLLRAAISSCSATMGALVFTIPLSAWYFGRLPLVGILGNFLCLWAAGLIFTLGLLAVVVSFFLPVLGLALGIVPRLLIGYVLKTAHVLAALPYHAVYLTNPYLAYWLGFAYLLFAAACLGGPKPRRKYALAVVLASLTLALTILYGARRFQADLDAVVLDVGQGQSVILSSGGQFALVDCGSGNSWISAGDRAADQLLSMGCRQLDYLILTHYDADHVSGVTGLLCRMKVDRLLVPKAEAEDGALPGILVEAAQARGTRVELVEEGYDALSLGKGGLKVYPPLGEGDGNDRGLAVLASAGELDLLITGDMDSGTERRFLAAWDLPDIEALVAGHHGSKYSTSQTLLETLDPENVVISVGENRYGHPTEEVLDRLARQGCAVYRTDLHGSVHLAMNGEEDREAG